MIKQILSRASLILCNAIVGAEKLWCLKASLVFKITIIFILLPGIGALFNLNTYHFPVFIGGFILFCLYAIRSNSFSINIPKSLEIPVLIFYIILIIQILTDKGFGIVSAGGYVILMTVIIYGIIRKQMPDIETIVKWMGLLFQILIIGIGFELIIILMGKQSILTELFNSESIAYYKNYNPADLIHFMGLAKNSGGANSILLGSQIAGMLCLFSTLWFSLVLYFPNLSKNKKITKYWLFVSILFLLATINGTTALLSTLGFSVAYLLSKNKKQRVNAYFLILFVLIVFYILISQGFIFNRIFSKESVTFSQEALEIFNRSGLEERIKDIAVIDYYFFIFFRPIEIWLQSDLFSLIFGSGNNLFIDDENYIGGDFGFGSEVLLKTGLIWAFTFSWAVLSNCFSIYSLQYRPVKSSNEWSALAKIFAILNLLWFTSLIHYTPATQNAGGYSLFGLTFALAIYCKYRFTKILDNENI